MSRATVITPRGFRAAKRRENKFTREHVEVLERRLDHLRERTENYRSDGDPSWDQSEASAHAWTLGGPIREWMALDPLVDVLWWENSWLEQAQLQDLVDLLGGWLTLGVPVARKDGSVWPETTRYELEGVEFTGELVDGSVCAHLTLLPLAPGADPQFPETVIALEPGKVLVIENPHRRRRKRKR